MNEKLENGLYILAEDTGSIAGLVGGTLEGAREIILLPSFLRQKLVSDGNRDFVVSLDSMIYNITDDYHGNSENKVWREMRDRFSKSAYMMIRPAASISRYAIGAAMVYDLSDGSMDHLGYLPIIMAFNLFAEGLHHVWRRIKKKKDISLDTHIEQ